MEQNNPPYLKATLGYGIIIAAAIIVFDLILFLLDLKTNSYLPFLSYVIMIAGAYMASVDFRNRHLGGTATYGQAFKTAFLSFVFLSIVMVIYTYLYYTAINPGAIQEELELAEQGMIERGMEDMEIEQAMKMIEAFQKPWLKALFALGNIIIGLIISLITSIFAKKEPVQAA